MITSQFTHEFFLGFWTMIALLTAAAYILIFCSDNTYKMIYTFGETINDKFDLMCGAVAQKLPSISQSPDV